MMTVLAMLVSLCVTGAASAATAYYSSDEVDFDAAVRTKHKEPKEVKYLSFNYGCVSTFYSATIKDMKVKGDRFKGHKGKANVVGKFSKSAKKLEVTVSIDGKDCDIDVVMVKGESSVPILP